MVEGRPVPKRKLVSSPSSFQAGLQMRGALFNDFVSRASDLGSFFRGNYVRFSFSRLVLATMSPRPTVKLDTPVTYRLYLSHRLPPSKKGGFVGPICACRTAKTIQVPKSQQRLVLRQTIAKAASLEVARHHALPLDSFTVAIDRAIMLFRRGCAEKDQNLPGVDIRSEDSWPDAEGAIQFWSHHGLAVPVWIEFYVKSPPDRGHSFSFPSKAVPPRGNEIAIHQALANEEAQIPRLHDTSSTASSTVIPSGSTTSESSRGSSGSDDET